MKNVLLIVNPVSGTLRGRDGLFDIVEAFSKKDIRPSVALTRYRGHASAIAAEAAASGGYDAVVCCGGDGTLNEVVSGIIGKGSSIPVGYIPAGSTNDFAAGLGLPSVPSEAATICADALLSAKGIDLDIGRFGKSRYFAYIASTGAFTNSSYSTPQTVKNTLGHLAYVLQGAIDFFSIKPSHVICVADGVRFDDDYVFCGACNSFSVGGIVKLDEKIVDLSDGLFEVVLVRNPRSPGEFNQVVNALMRSDLKSEMIDFVRASEVYFEVPPETQWSLDGEKAAGGDQVDIVNLPRAVHLLR
jgi:YegS/Rv2252/BmrU family lipid kinase